MQAPVVAPVDTVGGCVLDVREGEAGAGVEHGRADGLDPEQSVDRLHEDVVVRITDGPARAAMARQRGARSDELLCTEIRHRCDESNALMRPGVPRVLTATVRSAAGC